MLIVLTLLILVFIVVSSFGLTRFISLNVTKDRELSKTREDHLNQVIERIEVIASASIKMEKLISDKQIFLDEKMNALSTFVDERNTYVTFQQKQFKALAKSDMLAARRDELIRTKELKVALERIMSMATVSRQSPAAIDVLALESVTNRIKELETILFVERDDTMS